MNRLLITLLLAVCCLIVTARPAAAATPPGMVVSGNQLLTDSGQPVLIQGVNRSGTEYACAQGWGIFDGPSDAASIAAMAAWGINAVRVPLNEDCWLGINGVNPEYAGANYQAAIHAYVTSLLDAGLDVVLDLHWGAPGSQLALGQEQAPDADHAPAFWTSVAAQFKGVNGIAYDLFNEPHDISWACWLNGCETSAGWQAVGMQQLIDAVRSTGAEQPVIAEGLNYGGDLSGWLANEPSDPAGQLVAGWHIYDFSACNTVSCWDATVAPVAAQVPVLATEIGESDCAGTFLSTLVPWADAHDIGYLAWAWDTGSCSGGPSLISDYNGTPTAFGAAYRSDIADGTGSAGGTTTTPTTTPTATPTTTTTPAETTAPTATPGPLAATTAGAPTTTAPTTATPRIGTFPTIATPSQPVLHSTSPRAPTTSTRCRAMTRIRQRACAVHRPRPVCRRAVPDAFTLQAAVRLWWDPTQADISASAVSNTRCCGRLPRSRAGVSRGVSAAR